MDDPRRDAPPDVFYAFGRSKVVIGPLGGDVVHKPDEPALRR
jgi:hypothetical protein